jgi:hypothetical protein
MPKIRMTLRRTMLNDARDRNAKKVAAAILPVMQKQYRHLQRVIRKGGNLRKVMGKIDVPAELTTDQAVLYKAAVILKADPPLFQPPLPPPPQPKDDSWDAWKAALIIALLAALGDSADDIGGVESSVWESRGYAPLQFNPDQVVQDYQDRIGRNISNIADDTLAGVQAAIAAWYVSDAPFSDLVDQLGTWFDAGRAALIGRQEVGNLTSEITSQVMSFYGFKFWFWDAMGENPCHSDITLVDRTYAGCADLNGMRFPVGTPMPPDAAHVGCVLPGQIVSVPALSSGAKSFYHGLVIKIITANGRELSVTKNHPILTARGWIPAYLIHKGDNVITHRLPERIASCIYPDYQHIPSMIEEVFKSLGMSRFVITKSMPTSPEYFYGDGKGIDRDIDVIYTNGSLAFAIDASGIHEFNEFQFNRGNIDSEFLASDSPGDFFPRRNNSTASSLMRGGSVGLSLLRRHRFVSQDAGIAERSLSDAVLVEDSGYSPTSNPKSLSNLEFRDPGFVKADDFHFRKIISSIPSLLSDLDAGASQVVSNGLAFDVVPAANFLWRESAFIEPDKITGIIFIPEFSGHVYDLQSDLFGLYTCNGIITHNCYCQATPDEDSRVE